MAIIIIIKGDRRRQCLEKDFAHFAARGFEKEGRTKRPADPVAAPEKSQPVA